MTTLIQPIRRISVLAAVMLLMAAVYTWAPRLTHHGETIRLVLRLLYIVWAALFSVQMFRTVIFLLDARRNAPALITALHENGFIGTLWEVYRRQVFREARLSVLFLVWGVVILGIVAAVAYTGRLDESELLFRSPPNTVHEGVPLPRAGVFDFVTGDNNPTHYLRDLAGLVTTLKAFGARVVVAEEPFLDMPTSFHLAMLDSIQRSGVAVLYQNWPSFGFEYYPPKELRGPNGLSFMPAIRITSNVSSISPLDVGRASHTYWYPAVSTGVFLMTDLSLAAAVKFLGVPDTLSPICQSDRVIVGGLTIPVLSDGRALSLHSVRIDRAFLNFGARRELDSDSLKFYSYTDSRAYETFPPQFASEVRDRIVITAWKAGSPAAGRPIAYVNIIESLLRGDVVTVFDRLPVILAAAMIAIAGLLCFRIRLGIAVPAILALGALLFLGSIWALVTHALLLNMAYPTAAAILSAIVFPLARLSHENP